MSPYLTTEELAERFRVSVETARWWRHVGKGPQGVRIGKRVLYPVTAVEDYERELLAQAG